ncbi:MAG: hypothetical protein R2695_21460 [Acidimicrobiales bacterium]
MRAAPRLAARTAARKWSDPCDVGDLVDQVITDLVDLPMPPLAIFKMTCMSTPPWCWRA